MIRDNQARLAILISGRGSNMQAFIEACASGELDAQISVIISNNADAAGLERAAQAGIATCCIDHRAFPSREAFDQALVDQLQAHRADLVILAGFMRILTPVFIKPFAGRLLNIHPSLLPKYPGLHTHQRALDAGDTEAGVTVHFVTPELDDGQKELIAQKRAEFEESKKQQDAFSKSEYPEGAQFCSKCNTIALVMMDGCMTCLSCGDSKCG